MEIWLIWVIAGVAFFFIELFTPILFFLNLAFACLLSAVAAYYELAFAWQVAIFVLASTLLLIFLRPLLVKNVSVKDTSTGLEEKYINHDAKTIKPTNATDGRVAIYGEEWVARSNNGEEIEEGANVKIIRNEGTVFFVERI